MLNLTPFLIFEGNCTEAMHFYENCFGGELQIVTVGDMPNAGQVPAEQRARVAYANLKSDLIEFSGSDWLHPTRAPKQGNTVALYINGGAYDELRQIFDDLSPGADPALLDELQDAPFGTYGHLADKYGVHWFFQGEKSTMAPPGVGEPHHGQYEIVKALHASPAQGRAFEPSKGAQQKSPSGRSNPGRGST